TENYLVNFPQIQALSAGGIGSTTSSVPKQKPKAQAESTNLSLFPGPKNRRFSGGIIENEYEEEFPGLGRPGSSGTNKLVTGNKSMSTVSGASAKYKGPNSKAPPPNLS